MLPINSILCPTDFSDPAYEGVKAATEMAEHFQAELILVNVISPVSMASGAAPIGFHLPTLMKEMQTAAEKSMTDSQKRCRRDPLSCRGNRPTRL